MTRWLVAVAVMVGGCRGRGPDPEAADYNRPFVPVIAKIAASPKDPKPKTAKEDKSASTYTYDDPPAPAGVGAISIVVAKDRPGAWKASFSLREKATLRAFAPKDGATLLDMPDGWVDVMAGPLKGDVAHVDASGTSAQVYSVPFLVSAQSGPAEAPLLRWACDSGRAGAKTITVSQFLEECRDLVRKKLTVPDSADFHFVGVANQVITSRDCSHTWHSDVTAKNAFGVETTHNFACTYSAPKNLVEVAM